MPNSLHALHETAGAEFRSYADVQIVSTFGQPQAEYSAVRTGAGLIDLPQRAIIELTGKDRLSFLNNLLTNQAWNKQTKSGLAAHTGAYAFFLNTRGRIVCDVNVLELGERCLLEVDARIASAFLQSLQKYIFSDDVQIHSRQDELHGIAVHGPHAADILGEWSSAAVNSIAALQQLGSMEFIVESISVVVWRDDITGTPGFNMIVPASAVENIWRSLISRFSVPDSQQPAKMRLRPFGWAVLNTTRIEAGRPLFGIDFDENHLPAETGQMARAVSLTKGCYLGQEIVARMHARNQVARQIVGLRMKEDALPFAGSPIYDDQGNTVGGVTSSTVSPILSNACIVLAMVKAAFAQPGTQLKVPAEGANRSAQLTPLPFIAR